MRWWRGTSGGEAGHGSAPPRTTVPVIDQSGIPQPGPDGLATSYSTPIVLGAT
jgi:hypothetical protein